MTGHALRAVYGMYSLAAFVIVILLLFCPLLIAAPWLPARRFIGRWAVRSWLFSIGVSFRVRGLEKLPAGPCIVVCNHASYVDGIVLTAALPERFTFLVQHRAEQWPYVGLIIRRMGVRFVNRENPRAAARATLGLIRGARSGESFAIFPEGTFEKDPGLLPFQLGAFLVAAKTSRPVVPAAMRGTRRLLHDGARWPSWSAIEIELFDPVYAAGTHRSDAVTLRNSVASLVSAHCQEALHVISDTLQIHEAHEACDAGMSTE